METLKLEELAPYLPYGLKVGARTRYDKDERVGRLVEVTHKSNHGDWVKVFFDDVFTFVNTNTWEESASNMHYFFFKQDIIKPVLRPLSDFDLSDAYYEINEFHTLGYDNGLFNDAFSDGFEVQYLPYNTTQILLKHHFDVFGLIDRGLALSLHSIKQ